MCHLQSISPSRKIQKRTNGLDNCKEYLKKDVNERSKVLNHGRLCYGLTVTSDNAPACNNRQKFYIRKKNLTSLHEYTPRQNFVENSSIVIGGADSNGTSLRNNCA